MRLRLPNLEVFLWGDVPDAAKAALRDLEDDRLHLGARAQTSELLVETSGEGWTIAPREGQFEHLGSALAGPGEGSLLDALVGRLNRLSYEGDHDRLHLHAAAAELDGVGIALIGESGSGKSTVATQLLKLGARYLTDECLTLQPGSRTVFAYPKPITLKTGAANYLESQGLCVTELPHSSDGRVHLRGSTLGPTAPFATLGIIVAVRHDPSAAAVLRPMSSAEAAVRMLSDSLDGARMGPSALGVIAPHVGHSSLWELGLS